MEEAILRGLQQVFGSAFLDAVMPVISSLANGGMLWIIIALLLLVRRETRGCGVILALALIFSGLLCNVLLKHVFDRPRPFGVLENIVLLIPAPGDASFPSGHSSISFAAAMALTCMGKKWAVPAFILAGLIAFSRLYLQVHWPSDVLAGILLGIFCGWLAKFLFAKGQKKYNLL